MRRLIYWLLETICYLQSVGCTRREIQDRIAREEKYLLFLRKQCQRAHDDYERLVGVDGPVPAGLPDEIKEGEDMHNRASYLHLVTPEDVFNNLLGDLEVDL